MKVAAEPAVPQAERVGGDSDGSATQRGPSGVRLQRISKTAPPRLSSAVGTCMTAARPSSAVTTAIRASEATLTPSRKADAAFDARSLGSRHFYTFKPRRPLADDRGTLVVGFRP